MEIKVLVPFSEKDCRSFTRSHSFNAGTSSAHFALEGSLILLNCQPTTRSPQQKQWLEERYPLYQKHNVDGTLGQFFPSVYEGYFTLWPLTPTEKDINVAEGNVAAALAITRKREEHVREF